MSVRILLSCALGAAVLATSAQVALAQRHGGGHGHSHGGHGHSHGGHSHSGGHHHHGGGGGHYHGGGGHYHGGHYHGGGGYGGRYYGSYRPYYGLGYIGIGLGYGGYGGRNYGSGYYGSGYYGSGYYGSGYGGAYGYSAPAYYDSSYGAGGGYAVAPSDLTAAPAPASGYNPLPPQAGGAEGGGGVIEIASLADTGTTLKYALDEFPYDIQPGQIQQLQYDRPWVIEFHRGGSNGVARYSLVPGRYKFVGTDEGWDLVSRQPAVTGDPQSGSVTELPPPTPVTPKRPVPTPPTPMPPTPNE